MKMRFLLSAILLAFLSIPLTAAPQPKYKNVWLTGCARYDGYVMKKLPQGEGKITVYCSQDIEKKDVLSGEFTSDGRVVGAALKFAGDLIYTGEVSYELDDYSITYTLYGGSIEVYTYYKQVPIKNNDYYSDAGQMTRVLVNTSIKPESNVRKPVVFHIKDSLVLTREYHDFSITDAVLDADVVTSSLSRLDNLIVKDLDAFLEASYKPTMHYTQHFQLTSDGCKLTKADNYKISIGENIFMTCETVKVQNEFGLIDKYIEYNVENSQLGLLHFFCLENNGLSPDGPMMGDPNIVKYYMARLERKVGDGVVIYDYEADENWVSYCSPENQQLVESLEYDYDKPYRKVDSSSECNKGVLKVVYGDGRTFIGKFRCDSGDPFRAALLLKSLPEQTDWCDGVLKSPDGTEVVYERGYAMDEILQHIKEKRLARDEEFRKEQEAIKAEERKKQQEKQQLYNKYGQKYVDTIVESGGRKILVGTPLELVKGYCYTELYVDRGSEQRYYWYGYDYVGDKVYLGSFWARNGKVISVTYL